jgi:hypothetical protein
VSACPQCHLPKEEDAWQCDGCGLEFRKDFASVRTELHGKLRKVKLALMWTVICSLAAVGGAVLLAIYGRYILAGSLALGMFGGYATVLHRLSVLKGHLALLDRRHVALPAATARIRET